MASSSISNDTLPFATLLHMVTIKLTSSNYLLWRNQMVSILQCQDYFCHVDGSVSPPTPLIKDTAGKDCANPAFLTWRTIDQRLLTLLLSSLTEESMGEVLRCTTARAVWTSLESTYSHSSKSRELRLKDDLQLMKRGSMTVSEYGRKFKSLCDQLAAIGRPVDETDKSHWFSADLDPLSRVSLLLAWLSHLFLNLEIYYLMQKLFPCFNTLWKTLVPPQLRLLSLLSPANHRPHPTITATSHLSNPVATTRVRASLPILDHLERVSNVQNALHTAKSAALKDIMLIVVQIDILHRKHRLQPILPRHSKQVVL